MLMLRSALVCTVVSTVFEVLLLAFGSAVLLVAMLAVSDSTVPSATLLATTTVTFQLTVAPLTSPALVHVTVPALLPVPLPQPMLADTKLVPLGSTSVTLTPALSDGPLFVPVIV